MPKEPEARTHGAFVGPVLSVGGVMRDVKSYVVGPPVVHDPQLAPELAMVEHAQKLSMGLLNVMPDNVHWMHLEAELVRRGLWSAAATWSCDEPQVLFVERDARGRVESYTVMPISLDRLCPENPNHLGVLEHYAQRLQRDYVNVAQIKLYLAGLVKPCCYRVTDEQAAFIRDRWFSGRHMVPVELARYDHVVLGAGRASMLGMIQAELHRSGLNDRFHPSVETMIQCTACAEVVGTAGRRMQFATAMHERSNRSVARNLIIQTLPT